MRAVVLYTACVCFHIAQTQTVQTRQTVIKSEIYPASSAARGLYSIRRTLKLNAGKQLMLAELFKGETVKQSKVDFYWCCYTPHQRDKISLE